MKLDLEKWNTRRKAVEVEIARIKDILHTPGHQGSWKEWSDLGKASYEATSLYMLRAELRGEGRLHAKVEVRYVSDPKEPGKTIKQVVQLTREDQRERAFAGWHHDYLKPEPVAEPVSA